MALVRVTYVHNHDCPKKGQEVVNHSRTSDSAAAIDTLVCTERGPHQWSALEIVRREVL